MRFVFNEKKAAQAAAHLIARHGGQMNYTIMLKLLYLADRRSLTTRGAPITGDRMFNLPKGPVLSRILEFLHDGQVAGEDQEWFQTVEPANRYDVKIANGSPDQDELSEEEIRILDDVDTRFGRLTLGKMIELVHTLPEWKDPEGSSMSIDPSDILRAEGWSDEMIEAATMEAAEDRLFAKLG